VKDNAPKADITALVLAFWAATQHAQPKWLSSKARDALLSDAKALATLVKRYGPDVIAAAARVVVPKDSGRPPELWANWTQNMRLACWFEEHAKLGTRNRYSDAALTLWTVEKLFTGKKESTRKAFLKKVKRSRQKGQEELKARGAWPPPTLPPTSEGQVELTAAEQAGVDGAMRKLMQAAGYRPK
jgi:hypothetical protein